MAKLSITKLSFPQIMALDDSSHLFVINTSRQQVKPNGGDLNLEVRVGDTVSNILIPNTWAPWDIGAQISVKDLINNINFRRFINVGLMAVVDQKEALELMKLPDVKMEIKKINERVNTIHKNIVTVEGDQLEINTVDVSDDPMGGLITQVVGDDMEGVNPISLEIVNHEDLDNDGKYAMLLDNQDILSAKDWDFIMGHITDSEKIANLAKKHGYQPKA
jgi:hypothetical protein